MTNKIKSASFHHWQIDLTKKQTNRQADRLADRQAGRKTDRQIYRQAESKGN